MNRNVDSTKGRLKKTDSPGEKNSKEDLNRSVKDISSYEWRIISDNELDLIFNNNIIVD